MTNTFSAKAPNISCMHCVHTIKTEVSQLPGVKKVDAAPDTKLVTVVFEAPATQAQIESTMAEIGYPVAK